MGNICLLAAMGDDVGPHNGRLEVISSNWIRAKCWAKVSPCYYRSSSFIRNQSATVSKMARGVWQQYLQHLVSSCETAVLRRGEPGNVEADGALQVQLHRVGSLGEIRVHRCITTGDG